MLRVSYYLHTSGNYHVTLWGVGQAISVCPGFFRKVMQAGSVIVGCGEVDSQIAEQLGFVLPAELKQSAI